MSHQNSLTAFFQKTSKVISRTQIFSTCGCLFLYLLTIAPIRAQIKIDGVLNIREWGAISKTANIPFELGNCYYSLQNDTFFLAFAVIADNADNQSGTRAMDDQLDIYVDANGNNIHDAPDYIFTAGSRSRYGRLRKTCSSCLTSESNQQNGVYASGFSTSFGFGTYPHRIWEIAIPLNSLPTLKQTGFGFKLYSGYPKFSMVTLIDKNSNAYTSLLSLGKKRVVIEKSTVNSVQPTTTVNSDDIIGKRVLDDGGVETSYADGRKRIDYQASYVIIFPDGRRSIVSYMSVPQFVPPSSPDPNENRWLDSLSSSLLSLIADWLNNDPTSIANIKKEEASKTIYEIINRRCSIINYLNPNKK